MCSRLQRSFLHNHLKELTDHLQASKAPLPKDTAVIIRSGDIKVCSDCLSLAGSFTLMSCFNDDPVATVYKERRQDSCASIAFSLQTNDFIISETPLNTCENTGGTPAAAFDESQLDTLVCPLSKGKLR